MIASLFATRLGLRGPRPRILQKMPTAAQASGARSTL
jgi:hypothetical protein